VIDVRSLDLSDRSLLDAVVALQRASYAVEAELLGTDRIPALSETAEQLAAAGERFLGAFDHGVLVGAVSWKEDGVVVDIHRLVVHPNAFRRGVATRLLAALEAAHPAAQRVLVATGVANAPARALYEGRGFTAVTETDVAPGVRLVHLERVLRR
jgi:ribosomal protein S18 acetylase RimI-like enzyme